MTKSRRTYDEQFKIEAVELSFNSNKTCKEIAEELGVNYNSLIRWRKEYRDNGDLAFPGQGKQNLSPEEAEIQELKKELRIVQEERDILKKAASIFSKKPR
ncbi:transposase [Fuchsiella alkaliacetigena]|uniref:transposase n=1 Tax=Fuchsiella alkaliacetigena TaxID=957042 RepID=UPI00200AEF62|nr:transposase [Fuchsiella alkaliacetigena]MCK8826066.1 transposase [Fuchsiella alkaliacetigena]